MENIFLKIFLARWLTLFDTLQRLFWNYSYSSQPLLSTVFQGLIEDNNSKFSPIVPVAQIRDPSDYVNSVDLATACLVPTILQPPLTMNFTCGVDRPDYDLDDAHSVDSSHYCAFRPTSAVTPEGVLATSSAARLAHAKDDHVQTNMTPYGARGPSFCPVLVIIVYIHSLLHLYMLLMIPFIFNHWFEDVLVYESLHPVNLPDCSWLPHTSLWMVPWRLLRYGMHKAIPYLYRHIRRRDIHQLAHPPIPRIVLIRVDGEAVPAHFSNDYHRASVGVDISLTSKYVEASDSRAAISESGGPLDLVSSLVFGGNSCGGTSSMRTASHQGRFVKPEITLIVVNEIPDRQRESSPVFIETEDEPSQSDEKNIHIFPVPSTFIITTSNSWGVCQHDADNPGGRHPTLHPRSLGSNQAPDETRTSAEIAASLSVGLQDTFTSMKNVRFAVCDGARAGDSVQVSSSASNTNEYPTCAWTLESQLGDDTVRPVEIPVVLPSDPPMDERLPEQATLPVFPVVLGEKGGKEIDMLMQPLSPSLIEKPVVNLPSLAAPREDARFMEAVPTVPAALIEDIATRSPLQILCPNVPAVVLNPRDKATTCKTLEIASPEDRSHLPRPYMEGLDLVCFPIINAERPVGDVWTPVALHTSTCEISMPTGNTNLVVADTSPSTEGPEANGLHSSDGKDPVRSSRSGIRAPEASVSDTASTSMHLSAVSGSSKEAETTDQANFVATWKSDAILFGQPSRLSCVLVTESPMTRSYEGALSPRKGASSLPVISSRKNTRKMRDRKSREANTKPCNHPNAISKPLSQRTLSGSMHAPLEALQPNSHIDQTYETPPLFTCSVPLAEPDDGEACTSTITEDRLERGQDLFASIHAPQTIPKAEVRSLVSQSPDKIHHGHRRFITNLVEVCNGEPITKPRSPNWTAMPDVVDAFRLFTKADGENTIQRGSFIAECTNNTPMAGVVSKKGIATNSLNDTSVTANIQSRWMRGSGPLLVRDLVSSDPADFNLRTRTNLRTSKIHGIMNAMPVRRVPCPGGLDASSFELQDGVAPRPVPINLATTGIQSILMPRDCQEAEMGPTFGSRRWRTYRG